MGGLEDGGLEGWVGWKGGWVRRVGGLEDGGLEGWVG